MGEKFRIAIIGAGPAGLSAAARAATLGISHVLIEAAPHIADTVHRYQRRKLVMAEPAHLPLRSDLPFSAGARETLLTDWQREVEGRGIRLRTGACITDISGLEGNFCITLASGETLAAEHVVLAIGLQGNIRKLDIPGATLPGIQYQLDDPDAYSDETIVVIGGGDAGVENALALAAHNRVTLLNRHEEFNSCREANLNRLKEAIKTGRITAMTSTTPLRVDALVAETLPLTLLVQTPRGQEQIACQRIIARLGATPPRQMLDRLGILFPSDDPAAVPQLSERYESSTPGLYIIGTLAGYPLIKQALNQGYEVIEYILGHPVEPTDQALLQEKFAGMPGHLSVTEGIELIRATQPLLAGLSSLQLRELMLESNVLVPAAGTLLFRRNDYGNSFFSVLQGNVDVHLDTPDGRGVILALTSGDFFGELGLISGRRRSATVVAGGNCVLIETPRRTMLKLLDAAPSVQRQLDAVAVKRIVRQCFGGALPDEQIDALVATARPRRLGVGEVLFREGDVPDGLYLIKRGAVTVTREVDEHEVVAAYISAGSYVGEMALVSSQPRTATVRAAAPTEIVLIEAARFQAMLAAHPAVRSAVNARYLEGVQSREMARTGDNNALLRFLMTQGIGEATNVLLIDYAKCIRCDNCERACAEAHDGIPRFMRASGPTYEMIHIPAACRHCEHPRCMRDCPPDAIHRSANGEVYIDANCIGCGNCVHACPYNVIHMLNTPACRRPSLLQWLLGRDPGPQPAPIRPDAPLKAVKCDLCMNLVGGPACMRACPTGAAFRATPEQIMAMTNS